MENLGEKIINFMDKICLRKFLFHAFWGKLIVQQKRYLLFVFDFTCLKLIVK